MTEYNPDKNPVDRETEKHIKQVGKFIKQITTELGIRTLLHDMSKTKPPELETIRKYTPGLKGTTYGSEEYKKAIIGMEVAVAHHYMHNRHHPEHFEDGVSGMNLIDLVEMLCDWKAATLRHADGDIIRSISINTKRFNISDQLVQILLNTVDCFEEE